MPAGTPDAAASTLTAADGTCIANGVDAEQLTLTVRDDTNAALPGRDVTLVATANDTGTSIQTTPFRTDENGVCQFGVKSTDVHPVGTPTTFTATAEGVTVTQTANVAFTNPVTDAATSTVAAADGLCIDNNVSTEAITVTCLDASGEPLVGHNVTLAATANGGGVTVTDSPQVTDASGVAVFHVKSSTAHIGGDATVFTATDTTDTVTITQTASVQFTAKVADAGQCSCIPNDGYCIANNTDTEKVVVAIMDADGVPLAGHHVTLTAIANGVNVTITGSPGVTSAAGVVEFTVKSSDLHGTGTGVTEFQADDTDDTVTVTQTALVNFHGVITPSKPRLDFYIDKDRQGITTGEKTASLEVTLVPAGVGAGVVYPPAPDVNVSGPAAINVGTPGVFTALAAAYGPNYRWGYDDSIGFITLSVVDYIDVVIPTIVHPRRGGMY